MLQPVASGRTSVAVVTRPGSIKGEAQTILFSLPYRTRTLVTGGADFLGSHLCERLLNQGFHVICLDNLITGSVGNVAHLTANSSFTLIKSDITETLHLDDHVDYVFHLASPGSRPTIYASRYRPSKPGVPALSMR
jgi:hypothetical protein